VLATKKYNLADASDWERWLVSCYYSLTTMLTIGACTVVSGRRLVQRKP